MEREVRSLKKSVDDIGFIGKNLISINDLTNEQIYKLFELAYMVEPWNRSKLNVLPGCQMATLFFQPSTRTRMSFETAMNRLGGMVITETTPLITSSSAKEETLNDMMEVVSKYANIIVLRHPDENEAMEAVSYSECPVINGAFGHFEHPTQSLLDLYTIWRMYGKIEGLKVCIASPDLIHARTGHSMAYALARLGADLYMASLERLRTPESIMQKVRNFNSKVKEVFDQSKDEFNEFISDMDLVYLPGCSAPKGEDAEEFKKIMDNYYVKYETIERAFKANKRLYVTHTLPRRPGEMDLRIDKSPGEIYFKAILYSVSIRMALILSMIGL
ncbi:MAG: aspartate carbamoyltransferase [Spirochaetes bacterium]|nr:MAG: aspartate carbamoyltransferase [Spirochaetota bacterium]